MRDSTKKRASVFIGVVWAVLYGWMLLTELATEWGIGPDYFWVTSPRAISSWWVMFGSTPLLITLFIIWITSIKKKDS